MMVGAGLGVSSFSHCGHRKFKSERCKDDVDIVQIKAYLNAVQIGRPCSPRGLNVNPRTLVMSLAKLTAFERLFDRSAVAVTLLLGLAITAGTALIGA